MPTVDELILEITGNNKDINLKLADLNKKIGGVGTATANVTKKSAGLLSSMKLGWVAIAGTVYSVVRSIKSVVTSFGVQEKAQITLAAAMKQAGTFTEEAFQHNLDYAASLQKITTAGDETILAVQKLLTNYGAQGKELDDLTKATLDFASATGMSLEGAAALVGKTIGSSTNALTRYGIAVDGAVNSTDRMQSAVQGITKLFGGAAEAEAKSFTGQMTQLSNIIGDVKETIGGFIATAMSPFIKGLKNLITGESELSISTQDLISLTSEYKDITDKLKNSQNELTKSEKNLLELRKVEVQAEVINRIQKINDFYKKGNVFVKTGSEELKKQQGIVKNLSSVVDTLTESLIKNRNRYKEVTIELKGQNLEFWKRTKLEFESSELNRKITNETEERSQKVWRLGLALNSVIKLEKGEEEILNTIAKIYTQFPDLVDLRLIEDEKVRKEIEERIRLILAEKDVLVGLSKPVLDVSERIETFKNKLIETNAPLEHQLKAWEFLFEKIKNAGFASEEILEIITGLKTELSTIKDTEIKLKIEKVGGEIAEGFASVVGGSTGKEAANNFVGFLTDKLKGTGFIGSIIAAALQFLKTITGTGIKKFFDDFVSGLQQIISDIVSGSLLLLIEVAANPLFWIKLSVAIVKGIIDGFINFFKNIGAFFKELFAGGGQGIADDIFGNTEDTLDSINKKADELAEKLERINRISAAFEQSVKLNNTSLKEQIKFYEKQLQRLIDIGAARKDILDIEIKIADLQEDLRALTIQEILDQDKLLKLQEQAGFFEGDRISFLNQLLTILKNEEKQIKDIAAAEGIAVEEMEAYWDIAIEIKDVNDEIKDIQDSQTAAIFEQVDATKQLNEQQLSGLEKYLRKVLQIGGLPQFQIDPLIESGFQLPNLQAQFAALQQSIPSDLLNLQPIAPSNILPASGGSNPLAMLEGLIGQSTTTTNNNNNFGSFIDTFNNGGGVNTDLFRELFTKFASAMGFNQ